MRRAARVDANHREIADALRKCGCDVLELHAVGEGCTDLLVGSRGRLTLMEVKDGAKPPSARKLTPAQVEFHRRWKPYVRVVTSAEQAIREALG